MSETPDTRHLTLLPENRPLLMGVLNVTPDSFSDGGKYESFEKAFAGALHLLDEGADLIDVGGESTRPHAAEVSAEEELRRVLPVIQTLSAKCVPVSIDTRKPSIAAAALSAGATVLNDVSGLRDPEMISVAASHGCIVCIMHMLGTPETMQENPVYGDVVEDVRQYLLDQAETAIAGGVRPENIWIDPGIGFGKTVEHNLLLLRHLDRFVDTGLPVVVGVSRKSFIGKLLGDLPSAERLEGTLAAQVLAQAMGARVIRAHDVKSARRAMEMAAAILE